MNKDEKRDRDWLAALIVILVIIAGACPPTGFLRGL